VAGYGLFRLHILQANWALYLVTGDVTPAAVGKGSPPEGIGEGAGRQEAEHCKRGDPPSNRQTHGVPIILWEVIKQLIAPDLVQFLLM
jgi:hypothetical protein